MELKKDTFIFLYRSILFKGIKFKTNNSNLKSKVKALNIKNRKQRIIYVYNEAIKEINKYYSKDLCKFENGKCIAQRKNKSPHKNGCCRFCPLVTDKGCPSENLACKLIYCKTALKNIKLLKLREIEILKCLSPLQRITLKADFFSTKEQIIFDLYYGVVIAAFRITIQEIKRTFTKF